MNTHKPFNLFFAFVFAISLMGTPTPALAQDPNPTLIVRADVDTVEGWGWSLGATITIEIDDPETGVGPDITRTAVVYADPGKPGENRFDLDLKGVFDVKPGQTVTATVGTITKQNIVTPLAVTDVDVAMDIVSGTAAEGSNVNVWVCDNSACYNRHVITDGSGVWAANFSILGTGDDEQATFDIVPGTKGDSMQLDVDGDGTMAWFTVPEPPNPTFVVRADVDTVEGWGWPLGAMVAVTIDDPTCLNSPWMAEVYEIPGKDPVLYGFELDLNGKCDVKPGQTVTVGYSTTLKQTLVTALAVTDVNVATDVVSGVGDPNTPVDIYICDNKGCTNRHVSTDGSGIWAANFGIVGTGGDEQTTFDIVPGTKGDSMQPDSDGDGTMARFTVPEPGGGIIVTARPKDDIISGWGGWSGATVTLTIDDPEGKDYSGTADVYEQNPGNFRFDFNLKDIYDVKPGQTVTVTDGIYLRQMIVTTMAVTGIDLTTDVVSGVADLGLPVRVWICDVKMCVFRNVIVNEDGNWAADFHVAGAGEDEKDIYDIVPGSGGDSAQSDDDGDNTMDWFYVPIPPNPIVESNRLSNRVQGRDWPMGAAITLTINDPGNGEPPEYIDFTTFGQNPENPGNPNDLIALFYLNAPFTLEAGDVVTLTDGETIRSLTLSSLAITDFDLVEETVSGTAEPDVKVDIWACDNIHCAVRHEITDENGNWLVDFSQTGSESDEQDLFDIIGGIKGGAAVKDSMGNQTWADWNVPNPSFTALFPWNRIDAYRWPMGANLTLTIDDDPYNNPGVDYIGATIVGTENFNPPFDTWATFELLNFELRPGQLITITDGETVKTHVVQYVTVTEVYPETDTITGTAIPGAEVQIGRMCDESGCAYRGVIADPDGNWLADLTSRGNVGGNQGVFDIRPGSKSDAFIADVDDDRTSYQWDVPDLPIPPIPRVDIDVTTNMAYASDWPVGSDVTISFDITGSDKVWDYSKTVTVPEGHGGWCQFIIEIDPADFLIQAGQVVKITDGVTTRQAVIPLLTVASVDQAADTISGYARGAGTVNVQAYYMSEPGNGNRNVVANDGGYWVADFAHPGSGDDEKEIFNINGSQGFFWVSSPGDDYVNAKFQWGLGPTFSVVPADDQISTWGWPYGADLTLTIDNPLTDKNPDLTRNQMVQEGDRGWGGEATFMNLGEILPDFIVNLTDGTITKTHTVTSLAVTSVNTDTDTISGTAESGNRVLIGWLCSENGCAFRSETVVGGIWAANFAQWGDEGNEQNVFDIRAGTASEARQVDEDGDATTIKWWAPNPRFETNLDENFIHGFGWVPGTSVTLMLDDASNGVGIDYTQTLPVRTDNPWGADPWVGFEPPIKMEPGDTVTLTDGTLLKTHVATHITITSVDILADTVSGIADPGARVDVWSDTPSCCVNRSVFADSNGNWTVDFSDPGEEGWETETVDIQPNSGGQAAENDEDGDTTNIRWHSINPTLIIRTNSGTIEGLQWPLGATVTVEVDDPDTVLSPDLRREIKVEVAPWSSSETWFNLDLTGDYVLRPGNVITANDDVTTRTHVVTSLIFVNLNPDTDIISGKADPNSLLYVWACWNNVCVNREETANQAGDWQANFSIPGDLEWEQNTLNIRPGAWVDSAQYDEEGNTTNFGRVAGSTISGTVYAIENIPGNEAGGVMIEACTEDLAFCRTAITNENGLYEVFGLAAGSYTVRAIPPGLNLPGRIGPIDITYDEVISEQVILLPAPPPPLPPDPIEPAHTGGGTISIYWQDTLTLTAHGCAGGSAAFEFIVLDDSHKITGSMLETPAGSGIYTATLPSLYPHHGAAQVTYTILCPDNSTTVIPFFIYIDPSGVVKDVSGEPVSGATVTLLYSGNPDGPFNEVPEGSPMMSPSNRNNPDLTNAFGQFGWDVVAGFYKVRAEKAGCFAPGNPAIPYVESAVMSIPPAVTDLELILECKPENTPPTDVVVTAPIAPQPISDFVSVQVAFNDPDDIDTHQIVIEWGDMTSTDITVTSLTAVAIHKYPAAGVYMVKATVTDAAGESAQGTFLYVVIYDPNGGYVTGGGWITSPPGAYTPNPSLTGKATFGFVSRYQKGAKVPTGDTEFQFHVANMNFKSTSYQWLVIAGSKAQYKGTGTINGMGNYGFLLTAIDGTLDKFRIKIWDTATGTVIYDNMVGVEDDVNPVTVIGGGSIVIHK